MFFRQATIEDTPAPPPAPHPLLPYFAHGFAVICVENDRDSRGRLLGRRDGAEQGGQGAGLHVRDVPHGDRAQPVVADGRPRHVRAHPDHSGAARVQVRTTKV